MVTSPTSSTTATGPCSLTRLLDELEATLMIIVVQNNEERPMLPMQSIAENLIDVNQVVIRKVDGKSLDGRDEIVGARPI